MLDFRLETFLTLCKTRNYTKTAGELHITQPAVSQHIKYLENYYGCKLFHYSGKTLTLTTQGEKLKSFVMTMKANSGRIKELMGEEDNSYPITFGATLTIGEYVMGDIIKSLLKEHPDIRLTMEVDNTKELLEKLKDGQVDFVLLEGQFDKCKYSSMLFSMEEFIAVCSSESPLVLREVELEELFNERLILREYGSGSRDIFEQVLYEYNLTIDSFKSVTEIANIKVIKELVREDLGITFIYREAVKDELKKGILKEIKIKDFQVEREFNFVFLQESIHFQEYKEWFNYLLKLKLKNK